MLLGLKKKGFGKSKLNGYGGKVEEKETITSAAIRELKEESNIFGKEEDLQKVAILNFYFDEKEEWNQQVHVFLLRTWENEPIETKEMKPQWYEIENLPLEDMWLDDKYWLKKIFANQKVIARFYFNTQGDKILDHELVIVEEL